MVNKAPEIEILKRFLVNDSIKKRANHTEWGSLIKIYKSHCFNFFKSWWFFLVNNIGIKANDVITETKING